MIRVTLKRLGLDYGLFKTVSKLSLSNIISQMFRYAFWFLLMWVIAVEDYGKIRYAFTIASFFSLPVVSGFGGGITKFISEHLEDSETGRYAFHAILLDVLTLGVVIVVSGSLSVISSEVFPPLSIFFIIILSAYNLYYAYVRGIMDIRRLIWFGISVNGIRLFVVAIMMYFGLSLNVYYFMLAYGLPVILASVFLTLLGTKKISVSHCGLDRSIMKEISHLSLKGFVNAFFVMFVSQSNIIIIKIYFNYTSVAYYSLAYTIANVIQFISVGIIALQMPIISGFKGDSEKISRHTKKYLRMGVFILASLSVLLSLAIPFIFRYIIRPDYASAMPLTYFLIPGAFFSAMFSILAATWIGYGAPEKSVISVAFAIPLLFIINGLFIPLIGSYASAIAYTAAQIFAFSISYLLFRDEFYGANG